MKKVLAVSGGIDSMVMLDVLLKSCPKNELVVATFDHGTRTSSKDDVIFVKRKLSELDSEHEVTFYTDRVKLGEGISEEKARNFRYDFLRKIAEKEHGEIFTAHHLDDLVETTAINFMRGTGVRGLAGLSGFGIRRPFLDGSFNKIFDKRDILRYASENNIIFREDPTNSSDNYLRNRIRPLVFDLPRETKEEIFKLWAKQKETIAEIEAVLDDLMPKDHIFQRIWFKKLDEKASIEILREALLRANISATRPQILEFLNAIKTYLPGKYFNLPNDNLVRINKQSFKL